MTAERVRVGSVIELRERGCTVISAGGHGIAVFAHEGGFSAVDNRCPHMGFPLSRGTVRDSLLRMLRSRSTRRGSSAAR